MWRSYNNLNVVKKILLISFLGFIFFALAFSLVQANNEVKEWEEWEYFREKYPAEEFERFREQYPADKFLSPEEEMEAFKLFQQIAAQTTARTGCPAEGLVPCGTPGCPCTFCDFFVMFDRIIDFVLFRIVPPLAALMIAIGGFMYIFAYAGPTGGGPEMISRAKSLFKAVAIGLLIIYGAWVIVNMFFWAIGVAEWTGLREGWWTIECL